MLGKHYRSASAPGSGSPEGPSKRLKTAVSAVLQEEQLPLGSSWSDYLAKVKAVLPKFPLPGLSSFAVSVDVQDPASLLCITPPGQSGKGCLTSRVALNTAKEQKQDVYNAPSAKDYTTPVSAKPSHTVNINLASDLGSDDSSTLRSLSADTDSESPLDVFGLRKGPLLRTGRRSARDLVASKALVHLLAQEHITAPQQNYMQLRQNGHLKPMRRLELLEWMRMVCLDYTFHDETLYIAVNYLDRYLSAVKVTMRKQYHLLAISCIYLAAKYYEEIKEPCISDMVESAIDDITVKDLKRMERKMIQAMDWNFNVVTPHIIVHEVFTSLGTPDIRDAEIHPIDASLQTKSDVPSPAVRREVMVKCQEYFDLILNDYKCVGIAPSLIVMGVWTHLQRIGQTSVLHLTDSQLLYLFGKRSLQPSETSDVARVLESCMNEDL